MLIDVAVSTPVDRTFLYSVPESISSLASVGKRVLVPFGKRKITGYILNQYKDKCDTECNTGNIEIKDVIDILDETPVFPPSMLHLFKWLSEYYIYPIGQVIKNALPNNFKVYRKKNIYKNLFGEDIEPDVPLIPTEEQKNVISKIISSIGKGFITYLLAGVTGSGKTEVYLQAASQVIKMGYSVLILVPEIALISQTANRFRARFGEYIAVMHSSLSDGERFNQWMKILKKETAIVIGARSAIFAPLENLGLIIVDEEHDNSYKQENKFHYNARDVAIVRAKQNNCIALLGSATPSVQSYYNVYAKKFVMLSIKNRIEKKPMPLIEIVDLKKNKDFDKQSNFITPILYDAIKETLSSGYQVLLFLNRRGYANFPVCMACGETVKCKHCDISLTFHKQDLVYKCHYCGFVKKFNEGCQICGSLNIKLMGIGTEKIEYTVKALFPCAKVVRMDRDTTSKKGSVIDILKRLKEKKIDILVGTQMVAKGHDYPDITLVGVICAESSLNFPDFRTGERTFQLLTQVAGRAGRGDNKGKVVLQTFMPTHFSIKTAENHDFIEFYNKEIHFRKMLNYPPFSRLIQLRISGKDKDKVGEYVKKLGELCKNIKNNCNSFSAIEILGPVESFLFKIADKYRWHILLKGKTSNILKDFIKNLMHCNFKLKHRNIDFVIDVDPFQMI